MRSTDERGDEEDLSMRRNREAHACQQASSAFLDAPDSCPAVSAAPCCAQSCHDGPIATTSSSRAEETRAKCGPTRAHGSIPTSCRPRAGQGAYGLRQRLQYNLLFPIRYLWNRYLLRHHTLRPPIFVTGCGHSGTSLLLAMLASHSKIYAIPFESNLFLCDPVARVALASMFDRHTIAHAKVRWAEKTPLHIRHLSTLLTLYPKSPVIIMLRDGRDVACSLKERTGDFLGGVRRWVEDNTEGSRYWSHDSVVLLRYEDLVANPVATLAAIAAAIGEEYEDEMVTYYRRRVRFYSNVLRPPPSRTGQYHNQYRNWQINQPIFDGRGRWRTEMSADEKHAFKRIAGALLVKYGYTATDDW